MYFSRTLEDEVILVGLLIHLLTESTAFISLMIYLAGPIGFELHDVNCIVNSFSILVKLYIS